MVGALARRHWRHVTARQCRPRTNQRQRWHGITSKDAEPANCRKAHGWRQIDEQRGGSIPLMATLVNSASRAAQAEFMTGMGQMAGTISPGKDDVRDWRRGQRAGTRR